MKYLVSSAARGDLLSIWAFSAARWEEDRADLYIDSITVRFAWLTRNNGLWHARPELGHGLCSYPEKSHVIIFGEADGKLRIIRVLHTSMDVDRHIDR